MFTIFNHPRALHAYFCTLKLNKISLDLLFRSVVYNIFVALYRTLYR